ncbi:MULTISPECIES: class I SAM-dependent methyltransferase [unclassified Mucilaginibacter]|uniref:class I SAM-dependent methyltransferase n=1 Tax=unclassified Mucilaginibacter TaxID=2617802 RepID=UPI002AC93DF3|nr:MULTISPECIES: class I SAM-dependent methyltransferase [unclassified Mucilaginibacter]MEB0261170.1 class I SAM-dependent methyltransferase [Mucilaginibacter sp. 10I4]MEB0280342.1 class I SAM-dependent methyltransferase [Mucilaginibacter sp. 10B2]MEB0300363.1 class I SAM-dependent methyltransferase [Mucilaginibacter sp. 5C4]WPX24567.1 class I SAM-dependent methyltransferase [Mucilaginibacter sp. 5C4]
MIQLLTPTHWKDYELIDCGDFEKLERFGNTILIRPEPQAVWSKALSPAEWQHLHHIKFKGRSATAGDWVKKDPKTADRWHVEYKNNDVAIKFRLGLTSFKHLGIFPEQAVNWDYISDNIKKFKTPTPKVLNLFAYTGGASLIARAAGADTTHVDSIKQVVTWANENQELSGLKDIRWMVEDALKFVKREVKRGKTYNGIILDPPAYGNGPNGEKWKLEDNINEMMSDVMQLLDPEEHFLILNTYSLGFSSVIIENLIKSAYPAVENLEIGELYLHATAGLKLPLGVFGKFYKNKS